MPYQKHLKMQASGTADACVYFSGKGHSMNQPYTVSRTEKLKKKGRKGLFRLLFSRTGLVAVVLLLNIALLTAVVLRFREYILQYVGIATALSVVLMMVLISSRANASVKVTWLVIFTVLPVFGLVLYIYTQSDLGHRALRDRIHELIKKTRGKLSQTDAQGKLQLADAGAGGLSRYLWRCGHPTYENCDVTYFPSGEEKFAAMLQELEKARSFIFMEYFILEKGEMWDTVLDILERKAREGVDVRVMYDGTCEVALVPRGYARELEKRGLKAKAFAPLMPFLSTHYNYRDHRKILVIDGQVAFTGGINLADEYINRVDRFGHWKDTAIMVRGEAVKSFTRMFLQMWSMEGKTAEFDRFLAVPAEEPANARGYVIPYGDCPLDEDFIGERVYMDLLNRAQRYVHICTPYLILDGEMEAALKFAAERGVDVTLILPGTPDKKVPYALAKTHYPSLLDSGVKIYEYVPGFVHAKSFVCDDIEGVVGTINLDYRSLYHHFECAAYLYDVKCIGDMEADFQATLKKCRRVTRQTLKKEKWTRRFTGFVLKALAPLL